MKRLAKSVAVSLLALASRAVLRRYKPRIVMVTGSVGKTSTKDAIAQALSASFLVRKSEKSFNSEFGVPFTILGVTNPWGNPVAWLRVGLRAFALIALPNHYPNLLVLEVGADAPGDLAKILATAKPDALVVTRLPEIPVHVEFYATPEAVREEEFSPAEALPRDAPLIICADDPYALEMASRVPARLVTYGESAGSIVRLTDVDFLKDSGHVSGMRAVIASAGERAEVAVKGSVGKTQLLPLAAAVAAAHALDIPLGGAVEALAGYEPSPGRGRLFAGINGSTVIDDSYNASPIAVEEALATLARFPGAKRRVAVLGDMLELGRYSVMEHERIGAHVAKVADLLVTVGIRAKRFAASAVEAGMSEGKVTMFDDSRAAAAALPALLKEGDVVLVKGSQSIRMERIALALLASPEDRVKLSRQEPAWKRR
jgi:UDP-N-acetylmuramoyl-tripeptide--D-alanyl-D-alanine ligase